MGGGGPGDIPSTLAQTIRMEGDKIVLQFPSNPVMDMLSIYELLTGITLIKDTNILEGAPVSLATPRAVEKAEAVKLIEATLLTNGYAIVMEADGKSARILPARNQGANAVQFSHGVKFYTSAQDLPAGETIVTYFMKLDNLAPEEAGTMLSGHVGLGVYGRITPVLAPPGLLITESSTVVKQLISIREAIDIPATAASLVTKFIPLEHADAATVAQIIQATLTAQAQEKETKGVNTIRGSNASDGRERREGNDNNNSSSSSSRDARENAPRVNPIFVNGQWVIPNSPSEPATTAQVVADTRLNQILVVSSMADYTYIASMIAEFDKPLVVEVPYERKLKYAAAVDVMAAVVDVLTEPAGGATTLPGGGSLQQQRQQSFASTSSQLLSGRTTTGTRGGQVLTTAGGGTSDDTASATGGGVSRADLIQGPSEDNAPVSVLVGKTRVVADPMANSIIVVGRSGEIEKVNALLDKLDRRPAQVYLATVIGQLTLGDGFDFGFDYLSSVNDRDGAGNNFTAGQSTTGLLSGRVPDIRTNLANAIPGAAGLALYGQIGDSLDVYVSALETSDRFNILSRPSVFALNNKKATITSGTMIPVPTQSQTGTGNNNGNISVSYSFQDVVLKLEVVPLINDDGEVNLTIAQVNDTVTGEKIFPNVGSLPIIATEQIVTSVNVRDGNTIVLGGLISDSDKKSNSGVPFLSRIPAVGNLFKRNNNTKQRKELLIFIQPNVVTTDYQTQLQSVKEDYRTKVGAEAAERFPDDVDIQAIHAQEAEERAQEATKEKKGFFNRLFKRENKPKYATPPPPAAR